MTLRLHWSPDSANLVIRVALEVLGLPYEAVRLNRGAGDHKAAGYLEKNPQGLIPVLEDGDCVLFETGAILWHVAERAGRFGADGPPIDDPSTRAAALKWIFFLSNTLHSDLRIAFYPDRYVEETRALRAGIAKRMIAHCDLIEAQISTGGLLGDGVTVADIYLAVCLRWAQLYPRDGAMLAGLPPWPRLHALCERIEALPETRHAFAAEFIPGTHPITSPEEPDLPANEVTGLV